MHQIRRHYHGIDQDRNKALRNIRLAPRGLQLVLKTELNHLSILPMLCVLLIAVHTLTKHGKAEHSECSKSDFSVEELTKLPASANRAVLLFPDLKRVRLPCRSCSVACWFPFENFEPSLFPSKAETVSTFLTLLRIKPCTILHLISKVRFNKSAAKSHETFYRTGVC